ncbi:MAG: lamin tail domain-containing protein [bacterium]|nr:lamin tail domain-containing protein [bacterium]
MLPKVAVEFVQPAFLSITITEVMVDPCGESREVETANEYVELYNYGDTPVDVGGWWLMDTGSGGYGQPDEIVAWKTRNPFIQLGVDLITDSTIIQPGQYALVLAPLYAASGIDAPYQIPPTTIILTISQGTRIGDDSGGLWGTVRPRDLLVLYMGTNGQVDEVISTYGTLNQYLLAQPLDIADDGLDGISRYTMDCYSVQRLNLVGPDTDSNWDLLLGTPGYSHKP